MNRLMKPFLYIVLLVLLISCESRKTVAPEVSGYPTLNFAEEKIDLENGEYRFRQIIAVQSHNPENFTYAYKVETLQNLSLPGIETDDSGWILWPGATIWTDKDELSFDFESVNGSLTNLVNSVSARIRFPDGHIEELSSPFKSNRIFGSRLISPSEYGGTYTLGIEFILTEEIGDVYVDGNYAHHFMYRINQLDSDHNVVSEGTWYNSIDCPDIRRIHLSQHSEPAILSNEGDSFTEFEYYVVSRTGVIQQDPGSFVFRAISGFRPVAMIYPQTAVGIGAYHYTMQYPGWDPPLPTNNNGYFRSLWNNEGVWEAINSVDFKLHIQWGYSGQYNDNNPINTWETNVVLDENGVDYSSNIVAFWLRFDSDPFPNQDYYAGSEIVNDTNGNPWLRIHNLNHMSRYHVFENMNDGIHLFEVMAEDLQGELSDVCRYEFNLAHYDAPSARDGLLIIDGDSDNANMSPDYYVDSFYSNVVPSTLAPVYSMEFGQTVSAAAMMNRKAVLFHADNPVSSVDLRNHLDALNIYLSNNGNLILSGTHKLMNFITETSMHYYTEHIISDKFGISDPGLLEVMGTGLHLNPFFIKGIGLQQYGDIPLNLGDPFNPIVELGQGLSAVLLLDPALDLDWIYSVGCKPVDHEVFPPTQEQYEYYSSKYVGYRHNSGQSKVAVFTFPLSYMQEEAVANMLELVAEYFLAEDYAQGRKQ
ncbi:MAG: hypothetical protein M0R50_04235 [Candidatus Cloacimonetes bacterium]|nr:hypothetical protein [Candidatus Cloacimonadota bacterium]